MLVLFDIDGTLINTSGAGRRSLNRALELAAGIPDALAEVSLHGATDPRLVVEALQAAGQEPTPARVGAVLDRYLSCLETELERCRPVYQVLPGTVTLLKALQASAQHTIGLATGNLVEGARLKLSIGDLWGFFPFGGFGSDAGDRAELTRVGVARGRAEVRAARGVELSPEQIFVVGDTHHDVNAAHAAGARSIGVLEGSGVPELLREAGPELLVDSLSSPELWAALKLNPAV